MTKKVRKVRKSALIVLLIIIICIIGLLLFLFTSFNFKFIGKKSIHENSAKYQNAHCLVFYPNGTDNGGKVAESLCKGVKDDRIYDYTLKPYGDYKLVDYGQGTKYFIDSEGKELTISNEDIDGSAKQIISDYLRYQYKKEGRDEAYTTDFYEKSYVDNLDLSDSEYHVDGENLVVSLPSFDIDVNVPLKYMQAIIHKNLGYPNELYVKPRYIDPNRPMVAITFDDGPYIPTTSQIVDTLSYYDSVATFFCLGSNLRLDKEVPFIKEVVERGNEYASHTQSHLNLTKLDYDSIKEEILTPYNDLKDGFGYEMRLYRPPYGSLSDSVYEAQPFPAILWNVDSEDWKSRNPSTIKEVVYGSVDENDIVLFHDIYQTTADAMSEIVPELISRGYQLVTVSELMDALDVGYDTNRFSGK